MGKIQFGFVDAGGQQEALNLLTQAAGLGYQIHGGPFVFNGRMLTLISRDPEAIEVVSSLAGIVGEPI